MKIYNKKGFFSGLFTAAIGAALLGAGAHTGFARFDLKDAALAALCLFIGFGTIARSMSRRLSRGDKIAERDERNRLVRLQSRSRAFGVTQGVCMALMFLFLVLGVVRDFDGAVFLGLGLAFGISVSFLSELAAYFYYDGKL